MQSSRVAIAPASQWHLLSSESICGSRGRCVWWTSSVPSRVVAAAMRKLLRNIRAVLYHRHAVLNLESTIDRKSVGLICFLSFCRSTLLSCTLHVLVPSVSLPSWRGKASTGSETILSFRTFIAAVRCCVGCPNFASGSFWTFSVRDAATRAKLETETRNRLYDPNTYFSFVTVVGAFKSHIASDVGEAISSPLGPMLCPKQLIGLVKTHISWV